MYTIKKWTAFVAGFSSAAFACFDNCFKAVLADVSLVSIISHRTMQYRWACLERTNCQRRSAYKVRQYMMLCVSMSRINIKLNGSTPTREGHAPNRGDRNDYFFCVAVA